MSTKNSRQARTLAVARRSTWLSTPMTDKMPVDFNKMPITQHSPGVVARVGLNALGKKATVVPGLINKIYAWENRFIPRSWPVKLFGFLVRRASTERKKQAVEKLASA